MNPNIKTYLGKRGYILMKEHFTNEFINKLKKTLTVKPFINEDYAGPPEEFPVYTENKNKLYIPKFFGIQEVGKPDLIRIPPGKNINLKFNGQLKSKQIAPVDACLKALKDQGGGILSLGTGEGKTVIGLKLASDIGKRTLIIVHKGFLVNQWKERIEQFLPDAKIGIVQQDKIEVEGKDIIIGMVQSISMRNYALDTFDSIGLVIVDEIHHMGCQGFSKCFRKINAQYMIGLSATPTRQDGLTKVFKWYVGDIVYRGKVIDVNIAKVERLIVKSDNEYYQKEVMNYRKKPNIQRMLTNIIENLNRTRMIVNYIRDLVLDDRKILLFSHRLQQLDDIYQMVVKNKICSVGKYIGGMKEYELKSSEKNTLILSSYSMASDGLDLADLDALIMCTPKSNVIQVIGRLRLLKDKNADKQPLIIDVVDNFSVFINQAKTRMKLYKKRGYIVEDIRITDHGKIMGRNIVSAGCQHKDFDHTFLKSVDDEEIEPVPKINKNKCLF